MYPSEIELNKILQFIHFYINDQITSERALKTSVRRKKNELINLKINHEMKDFTQNQ